MARRRVQAEELSPTLAEAFRDLRNEFRADYAIGENSRFMPTPRGIASSGSGADYHYRSEPRFLRAIERARHYDRNDMVVGQGVDRLCENLLQTGYNLDVATPDEALNADLDLMFWDWADDPEQCDLEGEKCFAEYEELTMRHAIVDGDDLVLPLDEGSLEMIEAHRLRTPFGKKKNIVHGVQLDPANRKRVSYHITDEDIEPTVALSKANKSTAYSTRDEEGTRQVLHIYNPKRYSQRRGVTCLAPIGEVIGMHGDVQFATMVKAQVASAYAIIEEVDAIAPPRTGSGIQTGAQTTETQSDGSTRTIQGVSPGMRVRGEPGVKLKGFAPNIPNPEFFPHAMLLLTFIAINLKLPVHVLLLDPSKTNFSGWRGAIEQARIGFRRMQRWHIRKFHTPIYRWKLRQFAAKDPIINRHMEKHGARFFDHAWHPDAWAYIEPNKDAAADLLQTRNLMLSQRRRAMRLGMQFKPLVREIVEDNAHIIVEAHKKATELNRAYPELKITWREIACLPTPDGVTATLATDGKEDTADTDPEKKTAGAAA